MTDASTGAKTFITQSGMSIGHEMDHYTVMTSLNERSIYLKITDRVAYLCYEGNVDENDLRLSLDLQTSYRLMCNCFRREEGHAVEFVVNSGTMRLVFDACVGGYLKIHTEFLLHELVMSNDSQLTLNFLRLEQQLAPLIKQNRDLLQRVNELEQQLVPLVKQNQPLLQRIHDLEQRLESVADCGVMMHSIEAIRHRATPWYKLNLVELSFTDGHPVYLNKVKNFYLLKKLELHNGSIQNPRLRDTTLTSTTLEHLAVHNCACLSCLDGLDQLPNLTKLELRNCQPMQPFVDILKSYPHKIQEIIVASCPGVNQVALTTYCTQNNIRLTFS